MKGPVESVGNYLGSIYGQPTLDEVIENGSEQELRRISHVACLNAVGLSGVTVFLGTSLNKFNNVDITLGEELNNSDLVHAVEVGLNTIIRAPIAGAIALTSCVVVEALAIGRRVRKRRTATAQNDTIEE